MTDDQRLADLQARLADLDRLENGPHGGVPVIRQEIARARAYIEDLIDALGRGEEAFEAAIAEDRPARSPRVLMGGEDRFLAARAHLVILPDDDRPEEVWIRWDEVPVRLREDVISLASLYRDIVIDRKIGAPRKTPLS